MADDPELEEVPDESESDESAEELEESGSDSFVEIKEPEVDLEYELPNIAIWGRFWSMVEAEPIAVYSEVDPDFFENGDEEQIFDEVDEFESENEMATSPLNKNKVVILHGNEMLQEYDPLIIDREEFQRRILSRTLADTPTPEKTLEQYREFIRNYFTKSHLEELDALMRDEDIRQLEEWFSGLLSKFFSEELQHFEMCLQFIESDKEPPDSADGGSRQGKQNDGAEEDESGDSKIDERIAEGKLVDISMVNSPSEGVKTPDLTPGLEVYFRMVGEEVENLPDDLIDQQRNNPASVPMVGPILKIDDSPELPEGSEADPENYQTVIVEIEPNIFGGALAFKDDKIKIVKDEEDEENEIGDEIYLGFAVFVILLIILIILLF